MKRQVMVVTGSRADFGILEPVIEAVSQDPDLQLKLAVTGMHLSSEFGLTAQEITEAGWHIDHRVPCLMSGDLPGDIAKSVAQGTVGFADLFESHRPDVVVVLGDRFEILAAVQTALFYNIPVAHIQGGDVTEGAVDDSIRHAITKMSSLHFAGTENSRKRVIQLGEEPRFVFNFGSTAIDNLSRVEWLDREAISQHLKVSFGARNFMVTYHPVTRGRSSDERTFGEVLAALEKFPEAKIFLTLPNADAGNIPLRKMCQDFADKNGSRVHLFKSLGHRLYLNLVKQMDVVIGNSSSGLIEVPALRKPTVNIGSRQKGRERGETVIDCSENANEIEAAIRCALSEDFQRRLGNAKSPYGEVGGKSGMRIKEALKAVNLSELKQKGFFDLPLSLKEASL